MSITFIVIITAAYTLGLFYIAYRGDRQALEQQEKSNGLIYALSLSVYCTSWTYFGAVGTAANSGWDYIWIYVGPAMVFFCFPHVVRRIGDIVQRESITSLSDFLAARYGKSRGVAVLVTLAAVMGSLPYIALQLKSVGSSINTLTNQNEIITQPPHETILFTALAMAAFAILFGARNSDMTKHNPGVMRVLAFEAIVKIGALLCVCFLSTKILLQNGWTPQSATAQNFGQYRLSERAITGFFLATCAALCLPRQFHVSIIERRDSKEVDWARWVFPIYLLITTLVVVPITIAGKEILPAGVSPDLFVLRLPMETGNNLLTLFVFIGGFSAATGMVVVSTLALSSMITNDIIFPLFMESRHSRLRGWESYLVMIRRFVIVAILLLAYGYFRVAQDSAALAQIGLLSFAAASQFFPALLGAIYWRHAKRRGVIIGISLGMGLWIYTLFLPAVFGIENLKTLVPAGLNPEALFGLSFSDNLTHGVVVSIGANIISFVLVSLLSKEGLRDRVQAVAFTGLEDRNIAPHNPLDMRTDRITPDGLKTLASRFLNYQSVQHSFQDFEKDTGLPAHGGGETDWKLVQHTEKLLARAIGASSARVIMTSAVGGEDVDLDDVLTLFDQRSQSDKFSHHMLQAMLENISQGISVVDRNQNLVAWNGAYKDIFDYPKDMLKVGTHISELINYNIGRGWINTNDPQKTAKRRIDFMKAGHHYLYERQQPDGQYIRIQGSPMPGGGYLTTFSDITADKIREKQLIDTNETLEERVLKRTQQLENLTFELEDARREAVGANASKTRFLAAASHDLLQPLNAARLFLGAMDQSNGNRALIDKVDQSILSADNLLKGLLDISRLDASQVEPDYKVIPLNPLFEDLIDEAIPMAEQAGLELRFVPTSLSVLSDPNFLQSILRNLISNARRYSHQGGIVLGARRDGDDQVRIEVWDSGVGIAEDKLNMIFEEFQRLEPTDNLGIRGAGLGLSICKRLSDLMKAPLDCRSIVGKGSVFSLSVPRAEGLHQETRQRPETAELAANIPSMTILCIDDEKSILDAMAALLRKWKCQVLTCSDIKGAQQIVKDKEIDVIIADYQLGTKETGLDIIRDLRESISSSANVCLLTAQDTAQLSEEAREDNVRVLLKPANPKDIMSFLQSCS